MANYQDVGEPKPGATTLLDVVPAGQAAAAAAGDGELRARAHGRSSRTEGSWRWKMWQDHADKTHATFWQQMFRHLVTDTPGQVTASTPKSVLSDETQACRCAWKSATSSIKPVTRTPRCRLASCAGRYQRDSGTFSRPLEEGIYGGEWTAEKPGSYVVEIMAGREPEADRAGCAHVPPRRRGGRELPHLAEQGTAGEAERADRVAGTTNRLRRPS